MFGGKGFMIFSVITGVASLAISGITAIDQIKNGDRRAAIAGDAAGRAVVDEGQKRKIGLFGVQARVVDKLPED